uniref:Uncharacterized protein n=1 Tax=Aegilops tauschii subsp. strangulata TaxID=200361 RepID=A0A453DA71_AEGTS
QGIVKQFCRLCLEQGATWMQMSVSRSRTAGVRRSNGFGCSNFEYHYLPQLHSANFGLV